VEKPRATLRLIDPILDQACAGDIAALVAELVYSSKADRQLAIVLLKLLEHVLGRDIPLVIVGDALDSRDVPDRMQGPSADLPNALRNRIGRGKYLFTLFVEEKMVVAEMRARHMLMKILRLDVKGEHVGQDDRHGRRDILDCAGFKPWR
jgi:hypothetical protein